MSVGEILALYDRFGPEHAQEQAATQRTMQLQQLLTAISAVGGAANLENAPGDLAARRAMEQAQLQGVQANTTAQTTMLPGQVQAQTNANEGQAQQNAANMVMDPIRQKTAEIALSGQNFAQDHRGEDYARGVRMDEAKISGAGREAEAQQMAGLAHLLPVVQGLIGSYTVGGAPGKAPALTPQILQEVMAKLAGLPTLAGGLHENAAVHDQLVAQQAEEAKKKPLSMKDYFALGLQGSPTTAPMGSAGTNAGAFGAGAFTK